MMVDAVDLVRTLGTRAPQAVADEIVAALKAKDELRIARLEQLLRSVELELAASASRARYGGPSMPSAG